jgi:hypothetical protein
MDALAQVRAHAAADAADLPRLRALSIEERARMLHAACAAAAAILESRSQMGMAPPAPQPWPASTLDFLRRSADASRESRNA